MTTEILALIASLSLAALSFLFGGGAVARWLKRASRLIDVADLKEHFVTREEFKALERESMQWRDRMLTEVIEPQKEFAKTLSTLAATSAVQNESIKFLAKSVQDVSDDFRELRRERLRE